GEGAALGCVTVLPGSCEVPRAQLDRGLVVGKMRLDSRPFAEADPLVEGRGSITVFLPAATDDDAAKRTKRIVEQEAPAGVQVRISATGSPRFLLGRLGRLGLDAGLGRASPWTLPEEGTTPHDDRPSISMLLAREPATSADLALGVGPRLGM